MRAFKAIREAEFGDKPQSMIEENQMEQEEFFMDLKMAKRMFQNNDILTYVRKVIISNNFQVFNQVIAELKAQIAQIPSNGKAAINIPDYKPEVHDK